MAQGESTSADHGDFRARRGVKRVVKVLGGFALVCLLVAGTNQWGQGMVELEEDESSTAISSEGKEYCESFDGWLKEKCLDARRKEHAGPANWNDEQVSRQKNSNLSHHVSPSARTPAQCSHLFLYEDYGFGNVAQLADSVTRIRISRCDRLSVSTALSQFRLLWRHFRLCTVPRAVDYFLHSTLILF